MLEKKKLKNRRLLISYLIIIALLNLSVIIIYQYKKYNQIESRINSAYASTNFQSSTLYKLFSTFSEADYLFRMYAINFHDDDYSLYCKKLDTVKIVIDSLASLPIANNPIRNNRAYNETLVSEYLLLKRQVDHLVLYAQDTLVDLVKTEENSSKRKYPGIVIDSDKVIKSIVNDTSLWSSKKDTVVKKKESLFKRVFKAKNDTLVNANDSEVHNSNQIDIVLRKSLERLVDYNKNIYNSSFNQLRNTFEQLQAKERQLLFANFTLLSNLKSGIERLRHLEFENYTKNQESDFLIYQQNTKNIRTQLIIALSLMVLMIILIIGYQRQVHFYELKLIKEKEYANKVAEEKTSVLANISHEIRTPLNSLKGLVNILQQNNTEKVIDSEIIQSLDYDITVINSTINDILSLSKLEAESLQIKNEHINIFALIEDLISLHLYQAKIKGIELKNNNTLSKSILIHSNPFRIKQVVSNLIANAIKYTEKGHVIVTSEIRGNNVLLIKIEDTGVGIRKEHSDQVFRKYYIADDKNKAGGFGLGLYISKILSEQIGGKLSFTSIVQKGSTFTFELPLSNTKENSLEKPSGHTVNEVSEDLRIVFIDDSKINLFFVQQLFKDRKNVHFFMEANSALNFIKNNSVDIVITDIKMPKISGWDILDTIKSNPDLQHTRVFASTAEPLLLETIKSNYQFDGIINKPITEDELLSKIVNT